MNIGSNNFSLGLAYKSPFIHESQLTKKQIEEFSVDIDEVKDESFQGYVLAYSKNSEYDTNQQIVLDANKVDAYYKSEHQLKMSHKDIVEGVTYNPKTDMYTLVRDDQIEPRKSFTLNTKEPITKEYLEERYTKIQKFFETEYDGIVAKLEKHYEDTYEILPMPSQVKIDGRYVTIDPTEFREHELIYLDVKNNDESVSTNIYRNNLLGNDDLFQDAPEFEQLVKKWKVDDISALETWRRASTAVNLGLVDPGNQTYFIPLNYADKATHSLSGVQNQEFLDAVLDTIGEFSAGTGLSLESIFGTNRGDLQDMLDEYAKSEKNKDDMINNYTFTGDITLDENSTPEYKNFIMTKLKEFFEDRINTQIEALGEDPKDPAVSYKIGVKDPFLSNDLSNYRLLIKNLDAKIDKDVEENSSMLSQYTKNNKANPILTA